MNLFERIRRCETPEEMAETLIEELDMDTISDKYCKEVCPLDQETECDCRCTSLTDEECLAEVLGYEE